MNFKDINLSQNIISQITSENGSKLNKRIAELGVNAINADSLRKKYDITACRQLIKPILGNIAPKNKVQIFYNFKGGTGKTTICFQTAFMLSMFGFKILAIDLDSQGHLSNVLRFDETQKVKTMYDAIINGVEIQNCIYHLCDGLDAIPSTLELTKIEVPLSQKTRREEVLKRLLDPIKDQYDFILIDTNPTISTLNLNALFAADHINIVCETQPFSLNGLCILMEELENIFSDLGKELNLSVIANKFETKTATAQEVLGVLRMDYSKEMYQTVIRKSEDINLASKKRMPVISFSSKKSSAFEDLIDFVKEFIKEAI